MFEIYLLDLNHPKRYDTLQNGSFIPLRSFSQMADPKMVVFWSVPKSAIVEAVLLTMLEIKKKCSLNITLLNVLPYEL